MKATIKDARLFRNLIGAVSDLVEESTIVATSAGLKSQAMDPSHFAMVVFDFPSTMFESYQCTGEESFGVKLADLDALLGRASPEDILEVEFNNETKKINLLFAGISTRKFSTVTKPPDSSSVEPNLALDAKLLITSKSFKSVLDDARVVTGANISDAIHLTIDPKKLTAKAAGVSKSMEVEKIQGDASGILAIETADTKTASYNLSYLSSIVTAGSRVSELITAELSSNMPMKLSFALPSGKLTYYLAPKIDKE